MGAWSRGGGKAKYWAQRLLLGVFGPGQLDREHDPVEQLKREHGKREAP